MEDRKQDDVEKVLSDEILTDARRRAERTVKRAEREGEKLVDQAVKQAEAVHQEVLDQADARLERESHVFESALTLEARMARLRAQGKLLDEVFQEAMTRLVERRDLDYRSVVKALAVEAVLAMTGDQFVLHLGEADQASIKRGLPADVKAALRETAGRTVEITVADRAAPIQAGVVVTSADGRQRFDNSFAARLARADQALRFQVADLIFGKSDDGRTDAGESKP